MTVRTRRRCVETNVIIDTCSSARDIKNHPGHECSSQDEDIRLIFDVQPPPHAFLWLLLGDFNS